MNKNRVVTVIQRLTPVVVEVKLSDCKKIVEVKVPGIQGATGVIEPSIDVDLSQTYLRAKNGK